MTKYLCMLVAFAFAFSAIAGSASASVLNGDPNASTMQFKLGGLATIVVPRNGTGSATVSVTGTAATALTAEQGIWATVGFGPGTSLFTGVPFISNLIVTMENRDLTAATGGNQLNPVGPGTITGLTGKTGVNGFAGVIFLDGQKSAAMPLAKVGAFSKATTVVTLGDDASPQNVFAKITLTLGPWFTDAVVMSSIETNIIQIPSRNASTGNGNAFTLDPTSQENVRTLTTMGGFITTGMGVPLKETTVVIGGSNNFPTSATGGTGTVTLVTPMRVKTGVALVNSIPAVMRQKFSFVPEPGTLLLLVSGTIGIALAGRSRMKK